MNNKLSLLVLTLLFCVNISNAQLTWTTYNTSNSGLPNNFVLSIAIDAQGNKWFATGSGLSRFDGSNWTTYNTSNSGLANNDVWYVTIDALNTKWLGTYGGGVNSFDGTSWTTYNTSNSGLANNIVTAIAIDALGAKWFGTDGGVSRFDGTNWTTYNTSNSGLADNSVTSIIIDAQGVKWFGTAAGGVSKFDGTTWTTYDPFNSGLQSFGIPFIVIDAQGDKWFGTAGGGVSRFDGTAWTTYATQNSGLPNNIVTGIAIDAQGTKWFGTPDGVSKFNGVSWTTYNVNNSGLAGDNVECVAIDAQDNKWIGTLGAGVSTLSGYPLALRLLSFAAEAKNGANVLYWQTADEKDHQGFAIERSADGRSFEPIGFVNSAQQQSGHQSYTFTDAFPPESASYYRLKIKDLLGGFEYSEVKKLEGDQTSDAPTATYPHPVTNMLHFTTQHAGGILRIYNVTGRLLLQQAVTHQSCALDVSSFVPGVYFYSYGDSQGRFSKL
jgi:ligand-binding sensor domain-containing protein